MDSKWKAGRAAGDSDWTTRWSEAPLHAMNLEDWQHLCRFDHHRQRFLTVQDIQDFGFHAHIMAEYPNCVW